MNTSTQIKETKENGIYIICDLVGDGTEDNPYRPEVFDTYGKGYYHLDAKDIDYTKKTVKLWVNKKKTSKTDLDKIRIDTTILRLKETTEGVEKIMGFAINLNPFEGFKWPWEKTPKEHVEEAVKGSAVLGMVGVPGGRIAKAAPLIKTAAVGAGGLLLGSWLFGGKTSQEQKQAQQQTQPAQQQISPIDMQKAKDIVNRATAAATAAATQDTTQKLKFLTMPVTKSTYDITGRDVSIIGPRIQTTTNTTTQGPVSYTSQGIDLSSLAGLLSSQSGFGQDLLQQQDQAATATAKTADNTMTYVLIAAAIVGIYLYTKGKK